MKDIINNHKKSDRWKIQLTTAIKGAFSGQKIFGN